MMKNKNVVITTLLIALGFIAFLIFVPLNESMPMENNGKGSGFNYEKELKDADNKSTIVKIIEKCCPPCSKPNNPDIPNKPETPLDPEQAMWKLWYSGKDDDSQTGSEFSNQSYTK